MGTQKLVTGRTGAWLIASHAAIFDFDLHGVVLAGRSGFFSAGMDLKLLPTLPDPDLKSTLEHLARTTTRLFTFPKPVVAALCHSDNTSAPKSVVATSCMPVEIGIDRKSVV